MDKNLLILFIVLNIVNVVVQTIKSLATIKCGKGAAAVISALAYGFYTIVVVYTLCDLPLMWKAGIVALCNLVGVYAVKLGEEKARKEKLWKVEVTVSPLEAPALIEEAKAKDLPFNYVDVNKYYLFNFYCPTQADSTVIKNMLVKYNAKYFVSESKIL